MASRRSRVTPRCAHAAPPRSDQKHLATAGARLVYKTGDLACLRATRTHTARMQHLSTGLGGLEARMHRLAERPAATRLRFVFQVAKEGETNPPVGTRRAL